MPIPIFVTFPCTINFSVFAVIPMPWISGPLKELGDKYPVSYSFEIDEVKPCTRLVIWWLAILKPWFISVNISTKFFNLIISI